MEEDFQKLFCALLRVYRPEPEEAAALYRRILGLLQKASEKGP